jgi:hypothetical protein
MAQNPKGLSANLSANNPSKPGQHDMPGQQPSRRKFLLAAPLLLLPSGCATYKLGLPEGPPFNSVHVEVVKNSSFAPLMQGELTRALRETFATGPSHVRLGAAEASDATLSITVDNYRRRMATTNPKDTGEPNSYHLEIFAKATLVDNRTGKTYFKGRPFRQSIRSFGSDLLPERERQNLPLLARDLAKDIYEEVTTAW